MIIVEGLDNTGKTTLVEQIHGDFPQLKHVPSIGNKHVLEQIRQQALFSLIEDKENPLVLWDRCRFISEYVYNPVINERPLAFDHQSWMVMMGDYISRPQLLIYCRRPFGKITATFDEREQLGGVWENLDKLYLAYDKVMDFLSYCLRTVMHQRPVLVYDYELVNYESLLKPIIADYIEEVS